MNSWLRKCQLFTEKPFGEYGNTSAIAYGDEIIAHIETIAVTSAKLPIQHYLILTTVQCGGIVEGMADNSQRVWQAGQITT